MSKPLFTEAVEDDPAQDYVDAVCKTLQERTGAQGAVLVLVDGYVGVTVRNLEAKRQLVQDLRSIADGLEALADVPSKDMRS